MSEVTEDLNVVIDLLKEKIDELEVSLIAAQKEIAEKDTRIKELDVSLRRCHAEAEIWQEYAIQEIMRSYYENNAKEFIERIELEIYKERGRIK